MRNPNGYGSVIKLSGNRRKPYIVRKTVGWNGKNHPIYKTIGYYSTKEEGLIGLAEYNKSPWDIDTKNITFASLYDLWSKKKLNRMGRSSQDSLRAAYKHSTSIWGMKYKDIKSFHMQEIIDNCGYGYSTQGAIKNLFGHLDKFALEVDIITKGYSQLTAAQSIPATSKLPFTDSEISTLWINKNIEWVDSILFFLYTGFRLSELINLKTEKVDLKANTIQGGVKTKAGKDRIIPIHSKIFELVENRFNQGNKYLFSYNGKKLSTFKYYIIWNQIMNQLDMDKTPHECRHTFRSKLDSAGANKVCIDLMMGHKSKEVGERIYTHKTIQELKFAIELVTR